MFFGEWLAPSGKLEEIIINPCYGEQSVMDCLAVDMVVHIRQPRENTRPGGHTPWRANMRTLDDQPIWIQEATKKEPEPTASSIASSESLRVTISDPFLAQHCREVASKKGYVGNTAGSKAVMDVIRAAMRVESAKQNKANDSIQIDDPLDKKYLEFLVENAPRIREEPHFGEINTFEDAAKACVKFCRKERFCLNHYQMKTINQMSKLENDT